MASRRHRRRTGADRFWPGSPALAGPGPGSDPAAAAGPAGPGAPNAPAGLAAPAGPAAPAQPSWSDAWLDAPGDLDDQGSPDDPDGDLASPGTAAREVKVPRDPEAAARLICLRLLTVEPRTRAQLAQAMQRRYIPDEVAQGILDRFTEAGLIDDQAFARAWVESRHHSRGLSRRALSTELRRRGVAADDVRDAVETLGPDQEVATARQIVGRKLRSTRGQPPDARARRLVGALARKGYGPALAYRIVREALEAEGAELAGALDDPDPDLDLEDGQG